MTGLPSNVPVRRLPRNRTKSTHPAGDSSNTAEELDRAVQKLQQEKKKGTFVLKLSYQAVGVIFGDLGTSPLYTFPNVFSSEPTSLDVLGAVSIIFWTITLITIVKYILIVMNFNDEGEGGIFAMYALMCKRLGIGQYAHRIPSDVDMARGRKTNPLADKAAAAVRKSKRVQQALLLLAVLGTSMTIGDGVMTAAASVMSAMSGLQIPNPSLSNDVVVGISVAVIVVIFCLQRLGSSRIGFLYSPVLITWFLVNATIGVYNIIKWQPDIFKAVSPSYAVRYFQSGSRGAWLSLGGCVLCITGSEAMFADMGHFSHKSILIVALGLVYPSVLLIYFGEAAYLMHNTQDFTQSYFKAIPKPMYWPCFVIATAGALIGSQSLITSTFSIVRQAMRLNCFPPVKILHTGSKVEGQIYIPVVNWLLGLLTLACVLIFRSNTAIGNGFGVAVVAVMCITTLMASICMLLVWRLHPIIPFVFWLVLTFVEGIFLTSVLYKIPDGGWFPLALAAGFFFLACLWFWGMTKLLYHVNHMASRQAVDQMSSSEKAVDGELHRASGAVAARARGLAIYPTHPASGVPVGFLHLMRTMPVLHDATIFLTMRKVVLPHMGETERFEVRQLKGRCVYEVSCLYGFRDTVTQDRAFLQAMLCNICEDARYRAMAARSSAVDIYDQKEKADWKTLCIAPDAAVQKEGTLNAEVVLDVEVGPIEGKARSVKAAAVQLPQVSGQDKIAPPAATPAAATTAAPVQKQIQADCWHAHAEQMLASLQHDDEHWISGSQNSPANQQQPSSSQGFVEEELKALQTAAAVNVICVESQMAARAAEGTSWLKRIFIEYMFGGMCIIARSMPRQSVQTAQLLEIEVPVYL
ncbi:hypothetical protein WJX77_006388 [Trebouxia sp. C0004]